MGRPASTLLLVACLFLLTGLVPSQEIPRPPTSTGEPKKQEDALPSTKAEIREVLGRVELRLAGLSPGTEEKPNPLHAALTRQKEMLQSLTAILNQSERLATDNESAKKELDEATTRESAIAAEWGRLSSEKNPRDAEYLRLTDFDRRVRLKKAVDRRRELKLAEDAAAEALKSLQASESPDEAAQLDAALQTLNERIATKSDELNTKRTAAAAPEAIDLAAQELLAARLEAAVKLREKSRLQDPAWAALKDARINIARSRAGYAKFAFRIEDRRVTLYKGYEKEIQSSQDEAARKTEMAPHERAIAEGPAWARPYHELHLERLRAEAASAKMEATKAKWESRLSVAGDLGQAAEQARTLEERIRAADGGDELALPDSVSGLRRLERESTGHVTLALEALEALRVVDRETGENLITALQDQATFLARLEAAYDKVQADAASAGFVGLHAALGGENWQTLRDGLSKAIQHDVNIFRGMRQALREEQDGAPSQLARIQALAERASRNEAAIGERLLWTQDATLITGDTLRGAGEDLARYVDNTNQNLGWLVGAVVDRAKDDESRNELLIRLAIVVAVVLFVFWARRLTDPERYPRPAAVESPEEKDAEEPAEAKPARETKLSVGRSRPAPKVRFRDLVKTFFDGTRKTLRFAVIVGGVIWACDFPESVAQPLLIAVIAPLVYRAIYALICLLFEAPYHLVPVPDEVARILDRALKATLITCAVFLPIGMILEAVGYREENAGFLALWWTLFKVPLFLIIAVTLSRPRILSAITRRELEVPAYLRSCLIVGYPAVIFAVMFVLLLGSLRYNVAAFRFGKWFVTSGLLLTLAAIAYALARRPIYGGRNIDEVIPDDEFPDRERYITANRDLLGRRTARFLSRLILFGGAVFFILRARPIGRSALLDANLTGSENGLTPLRVIVGILLIWGLIVLLRYIQQFIRFVAMPSPPVDRGRQYTAVALVTYIIVAIVIFVVLRVLRVEGDQIAWFVSALALGLGFGLQSIVRNFISGIILLIDRPVQVGDRIEVGTMSGIVEKITLRATTIMTWDGVGVVIPNEDLISREVVNPSLGEETLRTILKFSAAYGSDTSLVRKLAMEVAEKHGLVLKKPGPEVFFDGFGDSSLDFELRYWTLLSTHRVRVASDIRFAIDAAFRRAGVEIPFPQRDLHLRSVEEGILPGSPPTGDAAPEGGSPSDEDRPEEEKAAPKE